MHRNGSPNPCKENVKHSSPPSVRWQKQQKLQSISESYKSQLTVHADIFLFWSHAGASTRSIEHMVMMGNCGMYPGGEKTANDKEKVSEHFKIKTDQSASSKSISPRIRAKMTNVVCIVRIVAIVITGRWQIDVIQRNLESWGATPRRISVKSRTDRYFIEIW